MTPETLLLRQIHPNFVIDGRVTSQAFRPTPKDVLRLSVDNGDKITPQEAWQRFSYMDGGASVGVQAVTQEECEKHNLPVLDDGIPYPEHCSVDFSAFDRKTVEKKAKILRDKAKERGWLFIGGRDEPVALVRANGD